MQLEFIAQISASLERTPTLSFCAALIAWRKRSSQEEAVTLLDETLELHMRQLRHLPYNDEYFVKLNPDLLLEVGREYLRFCGPEP